MDSRTSMDAPGSSGGSGGGGLLGFLWGRNKKGSKKAGAGAGAGSKKGVAGNDGFRGFSYVAPDALAKAVRSVRRACGVCGLRLHHVVLALSPQDLSAALAAEARAGADAIAVRQAKQRARRAAGKGREPKY